uniref:hypothetical protein n=1 Tax=Olsenella timonensis TaxID=1805478 RepID=UPI00094E849A|nr:hypothetical protein [Olsenella timonensis]
MIPIQKGAAPRELGIRIREIKATPDMTLNWPNISGTLGGAAGAKGKNKGSVVDAVKRALLRDQGGLCAYCMRKIDLGNSHVEHVVPQSEGRGSDDMLSVDYGNMLAVCDGFEGDRNGLTCDRARGNKKMTVSPLKPQTLEGIRYGRDGKIRSDRSEIEGDLTKTLNLNQESLRKNRKAVIDQLARYFKKIDERGGSVADHCKKQLDALRSETCQKSEYQGVRIYFFEKRLRAEGKRG